MLKKEQFDFRQNKFHTVQVVSDWKSENFENTNIVKDQVISLPMHTELSKSQIDFICNSIKEFFSNN